MISKKGQIGILILAGIVLVIALVGGAYYVGRQTSPKPSPPPVTSQTPPPSPQIASCKFVFKFGYGAQEGVDTFNDQYTHDMVDDPDITIPLSLSTEDIERVCRKMQEIDFFSYPDNFTLSVSSFTIPHKTYYLKVAYDSKVKELTWEDEQDYLGSLREKGYKDDKAEKLREVIETIYTILNSKEELKKLPKPRGGYL